MQTDQLRPVNLICNCRIPRRPPFRINPPVAAIIKQYVSGKLDSDSVLATWRCKNCKTLVAFTIRDLYLST